jgi:hypothetical protein
MASRKVVTENDFAEMIAFLERFIFRFINICRAKPSLVEAVLFPIARKLRSDGFQGWTEVRGKLKELLLKNANDDLFKESLKQRIKYTPTAGKIIKYFFATIEDYLPWYLKGSHGNPTPDKTVLIVAELCWTEHIYPQNAQVVDHVLEQQKNAIGNLTLFAPEDYRSSSNSPFDEKIPYYSQSRLSGTRELASLKRWTERELLKREKELFKRAIDIYKI